MHTFQPVLFCCSSCVARAGGRAGRGAGPQVPGTGRGGRRGGARAERPSARVTCARHFVHGPSWGGGCGVRRGEWCRGTRAGARATAGAGEPALPTCYPVHHARGRLCQLHGALDPGVHAARNQQRKCPLWRFFVCHPQTAVLFLFIVVSLRDMFILWVSV